MAMLQIRVCCFSTERLSNLARCATFTAARLLGGGVQLRLYAITFWRDPTEDESKPFDAELYSVIPFSESLSSFFPLCIGWR